VALLFMDGFEGNDATNAGASKWNSGSASSTTSPVRFAFTSSRASTGTLTKTIPATSKLTVGFAFCDNNASGGGQFSCLSLASNAGASTQLHMEYAGSTGLMKVYLGSSTTTLLGTTATAIPQHVNWGYVEIQATLSATVGTVKVRINGGPTNEINFTGNTEAAAFATFDTVVFQNSFVFDDIYLADGTGTVNNDFLGNVRVIPLVPAGVGAHAQFTPSTGSNWSCVDALPIQNTTHVSAASGSGDEDAYALSTLPYNPASVVGVQTNMSALQSGGTVTGKNLLHVGSSDFVGAAHSVSQSGQLWFGDVWDKNPSSNAAWTYADIGSLQSGVAVV
jgi:hypothetical protein